jgi:hypothetical protein
MRVLTWFPLVLAVNKQPDGANGWNRYFLAVYWRYHPHAAAIAAHETFECRRKSAFKAWPGVRGRARLLWDDAG